MLITEIAVYCDNRMKHIIQRVWEKYEAFFISEADDDVLRRARKIAKSYY
jgi:hypothetical protein